MNSHAFAGTSVEARKDAVLERRIDSVRVFRINLAAKAVASIGNEPIGIRYARSAACARRSADTEVVLRAAIDVVKRRGVIGCDIVKLGDGQVLLKLPIRTPVVALVNTAVAAN